MTKGGSVFAAVVVGITGTAVGLLLMFLGGGNAADPVVTDGAVLMLITPLLALLYVVWRTYRDF